MGRVKRVAEVRAAPVGAVKLDVVGDHTPRVPSVDDRLVSHGLVVAVIPNIGLRTIHVVLSSIHLDAAVDALPSRFVFVRAFWTPKEDDRRLDLVYPILGAHEPALDLYPASFILGPMGVVHPVITATRVIRRGWWGRRWRVRGVRNRRVAALDHWARNPPPIWIVRVWWRCKGGAEQPAYERERERLEPRFEAYASPPPRRLADTNSRNMSGQLKAADWVSGPRSAHPLRGQGRECPR